MRIFVIPGTYHFGNLGDLAMLQVALSRLRELWPAASFHVLTNNAAKLNEHCPGSLPISARGAKRWSQVKALPRVLFPGIPAIARRRFPLKARSLRPAIELLYPPNLRRTRTFAEALFNSQLVVLSGCGILTDAFQRNALTILDLLDTAIQCGIPCVLLGQGIGPMEDPALLNRAAGVLPQMRAIFLRERRAGSPLLEKLAVPSEKVFITGDDTIELAQAETPSTPGHAIGVNLRVAAYSALSEDMVAKVRTTIADKAARYQAAVAGIPILCDTESSDLRTLKRLLDGLPRLADEDGDCTTPLHVIRRISRCRILVAGSYHAAVFALSQGVPVIAVAQSRYYVDKLSGLAEQFGSGCLVVRAGDPEFAGALGAAIDQLWCEAPELKSGLQIAAGRQIEAADAAYARLPELLDFRSAAPPEFERELDRTAR